MINIPSKITPPLSKNTIGTLNKKSSMPLDKSTVRDLNLQKTNSTAENRTLKSVHENRIQQGSRPPVRQGVQTTSIPQSVPIAVNNHSSVNSALPDIVVPALRNALRKGQKTALSLQGQSISKIKACFGWNILDSRCDMDASAFLVTDNGKVPGDDWFVFYGQTSSPDGSIRFFNDSTLQDREVINVDFGRLNTEIKKVVFVLTINEAFENNLNFSMIKDAYVRLIDVANNREIVSYKLEEYYSNVTSMTIGELYLHNGQWKFNPVGNGVQQDLAGQCAIYGVQIG